LKIHVSVLVIDEDASRATLLEQALIDQGYQVLARIDSTDQLAEHVEQLKPDILNIA